MNQTDLFETNMKIGEIDPKDRRFWPKEPEPGFDPKHNEKVIKKTIEKNEKLRKRKKQEYRDILRERTDAVAHFLKRKAWGYGKPIEKYLGKRELAALRGEDIITRIKNAKAKQEGS